MMATLVDWLIVVLFVAGLLFTFVSTLGVIRLPDVYSRAHTASQADTLGAGFALAGVALAIGLDATAFKTVLLLAFIFVTNPTAAHAIARAAHEEGIEPWTTDDDRTDEDLLRASERDTVAGEQGTGPEKPDAGDEQSNPTGAQGGPSDPTATDGGAPASGGEQP